MMPPNLGLPMVDEVHNRSQDPVLDRPHVDEGMGVWVPRQQVPENKEGLGYDYSEQRDFPT